MSICKSCGMDRELVLEECVYCHSIEKNILKKELERTECERDTAVANALKRIEQLEENHINSIVDLAAQNTKLQQTINELRSHR